MRIDTEAEHSQKELLDAVWAAVTKLYGEYGASLADMRLIDYDALKKIGVLRVSLAALTSVRASLVSITRLAGKEAAVHVVAVSGTLKSLRERTQ